MLRRTLLGAARSTRLKRLVTAAPIAADVVERYVAGESVTDAIAASRKLVGAGLQVSIDHLGESTTKRSQADAAATAYLDLLAAISAAGLSGAAEISVKLSALGQQLPDGDRIAFENAELICGAARNAATTVTVDMEDHTTTDSTLRIVAELRQDFPDTGAVLQSYLHRTEGDCRELAEAGARVRLCKGAYAEPPSVAFTERTEIDRSYVRCLKILMAGAGYPMVATHDPRLIEIAKHLAADQGRQPDRFEFQMLFGIRPEEQQRLVNQGFRTRVYLPFGTDWYGYLVRRLAERPANLTFFARSLLSRD